MLCYAVDWGEKKWNLLYGVSAFCYTNDTDAFVPIFISKMQVLTGRICVDDPSEFVSAIFTIRLITLVLKKKKQKIDYALLPDHYEQLNLLSNLSRSVLQECNNKTIVDTKRPNTRWALAGLQCFISEH